MYWMKEIRVPTVMMPARMEPPAYQMISATARELMKSTLGYRITSYNVCYTKLLRPLLMIGSLILMFNTDSRLSLIMLPSYNFV